MRLLVINGSPHAAGGNTAGLTAELTKPWREADGEVVERYVARMDVRPCNATALCLAGEPCPIKDDVAALHAEMRSADALVLAGPVFIFSVTAQLKAFLDRSMALLHRPEMTGKHAVAVATSAGMGEQEVARYLGTCCEMLGYDLVGELAGVFMVYSRPNDGEALFARARRLGEELVLAVREKRKYPKLGLHAAQHRFLRDLIQRNRKLFKGDHAYWQERGWLETRWPPKGEY
ncbi:MAG TPA: flavodoxin family protein [bacterium]|nr:flavodoxin family protein [bacterium]